MSSLSLAIPICLFSFLMDTMCVRKCIITENAKAYGNEHITKQIYKKFLITT